MTEAHSLGVLVNLFADEVLNLHLAFVSINLSFKRVARVNKPFGGDIDALCAVGASLRSGTGEYVVTANEARRQNPLCGEFRN